MSERQSSDAVILGPVEDHVVTISLNRPEKANTVASPEMNLLLAEAFRAAQDDDDVKVIVLTGEGKHFCGGEDIRRTPMDNSSAGGGRPPQSKRLRHISEIEDIWFDEILLCDKTVIAACHGAAIGLGFRLALLCDLVIASDDAYFGRPQSRIGLAGLDMSLPVLLGRLGINRGYELLLTGRTATADELHDWGFISSVVPRDQLDAEVRRYAKAVASHSTDGLMIGRQAMKSYWALQGIEQWRSFAGVAHTLFTNLKWRDDEVNLFKERAMADNPRDALRRVYARWEELGFK